VNAAIDKTILIKEKMMKLQDRFTENAHWLLRIGVVSVFLYHGILKFSNLEGFATMLPISYTEVVFVALANVGSVLVILGGFRNDVISDLATRIGAALNIPVMAGAIALVHWGRWNFVPTETHPMGGMEFQATLVLLMLYLVITGNKGIKPLSPAASTA
jgi:putative oxidoreductase